MRINGVLFVFLCTIAYLLLVFEISYVGAVIGNRYGAGEDPIWLDDVICTGIESGIEQCVHLPWGTNDCDHSEDVSISCSNPETKGIFSCSIFRLRDVLK